MNWLPALGVLLLVLWLVARIALAITSALLHLIWLAALVLFAIWLARKLTGKR